MKTAMGLSEAVPIPYLTSRKEKIMDPMFLAILAMLGVETVIDLIGA